MCGTRKAVVATRVQTLCPIILACLSESDLRWPIHEGRKNVCLGLECLRANPRANRACYLMGKGRAFPALACISVRLRNIVKYTNIPVINGK